MSERGPRLQLIRPVLNLDESHYKSIGQAVAAQGVNPSLVRLFWTPELSANVLSTGEIAHFWEEMGTIPTAKRIDTLAEHLENTMPASCDQTLIVPTLPISIKPKSLRQQNTEVFTVGTNNVTMLAEHEAAKLSINQFTQTPDGPVADEEAWLGASNLRDVWLAQANDPTAKSVLRQVLATAIDLPSEIELGPVEIKVS